MKTSCAGKKPPSEHRDIRPGSYRKRTGSHRAFTVLSSLFILLAFAALAGASGGEADTRAKLMNFAWKTLDFAVLAGLIYWMAGKKAKDFFSGRRENIRKALEEAAIAREDAQKKFREYDEKLEKATSEIAELTKMIEEQGMAEKQKIMKEANEIAAKMKEDTLIRMEQEFKKAKQQLRIEAVRYATQMAETILRQNIRVEDHEKMVRDYINDAVKTH